MVTDGAVSIETTGATAGVNTLQFAAGQAPPALVMGHTLRPAVGGRSSVAGLAGAHWSVTQGLAARVEAAGRWLTRSGWLTRHWWGHRDLLTSREGVPLLTRGTGADGVVSDDLTQGPEATPAHTGVLTLVDKTGQLGRTVTTDHTLGAAVGRGPQVPGDTGALTPTTDLSVAGEGAAVVVVTRLPSLR